MINRYLQFIKESKLTESNFEKSKDSDKYTELKDEVKSMIEKTI